MNITKARKDKYQKTKKDEGDERKTKEDKKDDIDTGEAAQYSVPAEASEDRWGRKGEYLGQVV